MTVADKAKAVRVAKPTWMYKAAKNDDGYEAHLFDHPDDVPAKAGWEDSPADFIEAAKKKAAK